MSINVKFGGVSVVVPGVYVGTMASASQDPRSRFVEKLAYLLYRLNVKAVRGFGGSDFDEYVCRVQGTPEHYEKIRFLEKCIGMKNTPEAQEYIRMNLRAIEEKYWRRHGNPFWY